MIRCRLVTAGILLAGTAVAEPAPEAAPPTPEDVPALTDPPSASQPVDPAPARPPATARMPEPSSRAASVFSPWSPARLVLDLELTSHARYASTAGTNLSEVRLDRGEIGARLGLGAHAAAELRFEAIRSAIDGGALGIDGDSMVARIKYARVLGEKVLRPVTLGGSFGFTPDPWIRALEDGYPLKPLSRTATERLLAWPTSDLAAVVSAAFGPARLSVSLGNGEGQRYPERNSGKTTTAVAEVVALNLPATRITLAAVVRDGSVGVARIRDRRAGGAGSLITPWVRVGGEVVKAWGIGDRGDATGLLLGGWGEARIVDSVFVAARGGSLGYTAGGRRSTFGGAIALEPWRKTGGQLRVWLAVDRVTSSAAAMPLPGADAGDATIGMVIVSALAPVVFE